MPRTGSILVIDHDPTIVELLVELLTDEGYVVYGAANGAHALAALALHPPLLILLDLGRPGMSDVQLIAQMRRACLTAVPIVLMATELRDVERLFVPESFECLVKPFDLDDLLACVACHVQLADAPDQPLAHCAT
jgi:DNA-binding response OmpR family regulator